MDADTSLFVAMIENLTPHEAGMEQGQAYPHELKIEGGF